MQQSNYTKVDNGFIEAVGKSASFRYEVRVLACIIRLTWGYHREADRISYSQFVDFTEIKRWHVARAIEALRSKGIISITKDGQYCIYQVLNPSKWGEPLPVEVMLDDEKPLPLMVTEPLPVEVIPNDEKPLPLMGEPLPIEVIEPLPVEVTTKERKKITKEIPYGENPDGLRKGDISGENLTSKEKPQPVSFQDWLDLLNSDETKNKVGFLMGAFKTLHPNAPPADLENLGGRVAALTRITKDYPVILKAIWDTATMNPVGSHLNYITKKLKNGSGSFKSKEEKPRPKSEPRIW